MYVHAIPQKWVMRITTGKNIFKAIHLQVWWKLPEVSTVKDQKKFLCKGTFEVLWQESRWLHSGEIYNPGLRSYLTTLLAPWSISKRLYSEVRSNGELGSECLSEILNIISENLSLNPLHFTVFVISHGCITFNIGIALSTGKFCSYVFWGNNI